MKVMDMLHQAGYRQDWSPVGEETRKRNKYSADAVGRVGEVATRLLCLRWRLA